jgi:hypothetical protein
MNCHFDTFVKTGEREGNFFPTQSWLLLMNHEGKVYSGTAMSFVANKKKHIVYAPQFTHSIQKEGKACADCHDNEATKLIQQGKSVPMTVFVDGTLETWKGVVPVVHESLQWTYLDKSGDEWIPLETNEPETVQWWYAKPLTKKQIKKLSRKPPRGGRRGP